MRMLRLTALFALVGLAATATGNAAAISRVRVGGVGPAGATVSWRLARPGRTWLEVLQGGVPVLWFPARRSGSTYSARLEPLHARTTYRFRIVARRARAAGSLTTRAPNPSAKATVRDGRMELDGKPFFPLMAWNQCSTTFDTGLAVGLNVFLGGCNWESPQTSIDALRGRGYLVLPVADHGIADGPGVIGFNYPDELDATGVAAATQPDLPSGNGKLRFWTLSYHFYSVADPIAPGIGKEIYPSFYAKADVVGFDIYPLVKLCGNPWIGVASVFDALRELVAATQKPAYEWIETTPMEGECGPSPVTPASVRAETWLAIAAGASGVGYFTHTWPFGATPASPTWQRFHVAPAITTAMRETNRAIAQLVPALLSPPAVISLDPGSPVRVGARTLNGATYVIVVNPTRSTARASFVIPGRRSTPVRDVLGARTVVGAAGRVHDSFPPYAARLYVIPPAWAAG